MKGFNRLLKDYVSHVKQEYSLYKITCNKARNIRRLFLFPANDLIIMTNPTQTNAKITLIPKIVQKHQKIFHYQSITYKLFFGLCQPLGHLAIYVHKSNSKIMTRINAKDAIEKIRKLLFTDSGKTAAPTTKNGATTTVSYNLKDGTPIKVEGSLANGAAVLVPGTDGDTPAPDGELELADGTVISVTGGIITNIETAGQSADSKDGGDAPDESQFSAVNALESKIAEIEKEINSFRQSFKNQSLAQEQVLDLIGRLAELPSSEPVSRPKNAFSEIRSKQEEKIRHLADSLKRIKELRIKN